jgi:hypothetical protein
MLLSLLETKKILLEQKQLEEKINLNISNLKNKTEELENSYSENENSNIS